MTYISPRKYQPIYKSLLTVAEKAEDGNLRESLTLRIKFGNNYILKDKIRILAQDTGIISKTYAGGVELFADDVARLRNSFAHGRSSSHTQRDNIDIIDINTNLKVLIAYFLLLQTGLPETLIKENFFSADFPPYL